MSLTVVVLSTGVTLEAARLTPPECMCLHPMFIVTSWCFSAVTWAIAMVFRQSMLHAFKDKHSLTEGKSGLHRGMGLSLCYSRSRTYLHSELELKAFVEFSIRLELRVCNSIDNYAQFIHNHSQSQHHHRAGNNHQTDAYLDDEMSAKPFLIHQSVDKVTFLSDLHMLKHKGKKR